MFNNKTQFIYFDLDGTLLNSKKEITKETLESISKLKSQNWKIGIATGRPPYMIKKEHRLIKPDLPVITTNGALITNNRLETEKPLEMNCLSKEIAYSIFNFLKKIKISFLVNADDCHYFIEENENKSYWINWLRATIKKRNSDEKWELKKIEDNYDINKVNVLKFLVIPDQKGERDLEPLLNFLKNEQSRLKNSNELTWLPSQSHVLDIFNGNVNKGSYLKKMGKKENINLEKLVVFGDALNDVSLFEVAKTSIAMKNANPLLKKIATYTTKSNDNNGVAYFIKERILNEN